MLQPLPSWRKRQSPTCGTARTPLRGTTPRPSRLTARHRRAERAKPQAVRQQTRAAPHGRGRRAARKSIGRKGHCARLTSRSGREVMKRVARHPEFCSITHRTGGRSTK
jgi:hypothetical protein